MLRLPIIADLLFFITGGIHAQSQLGIGTNSPDAQAILDLVSTNRGVLIPRMTTAQRNAITVNATDEGLLIYNTSDSEFNYWDGAQWVSFPAPLAQDADWFEVGTTTAPDDINDNIFTQGNVGIGTPSPAVPLTVQGNGIQTLASFSLLNAPATLGGFGFALGGSGTGNYTGLYNSLELTGAGGFRTGLYNTLTAGVSGMTGFIKGIDQFIDFDGGGQAIGVRTAIEGTSGGGDEVIGVGNYLTNESSGLVAGVETEITNNSNGSLYGVLNTLTGSTIGARFGTANFLTGTPASGTSPHFGVLNSIQTDGAGLQFGVDNSLTGLSTSLKTGVRNTLSGGNGTHIGTNNILTGSGTGDRVGTINQILQGPVSGTPVMYAVDNFVEATGDGERYGVRNRITGTAIGIRYGTCTEVSGTPASGSADHYGTYQELSADGTNNQTGTYSELNGFTSGNKRGIQNVIYNSDGSHIGVDNLLSGTGNGFRIGVNTEIFQNPSVGGNHYGMYNRIVSGGSGSRYGIYQDMSGLGTGNFIGIETAVTTTPAGSSTHMGAYNRINSGGGGDRYGVKNDVLGTTSGEQIGVENYLGNGTFAQYGVRNIMSSNTSSVRYGVHTTISGISADPHFGARNTLSASGGGDRYGTYNDIAALGNGDFKELTTPSTHREPASSQAPRIRFPAPAAAISLAFCPA